jgi:GNAT superfamily N-acetyltransferase
MAPLETADLANATALSAALNWPYRLEDWAFAHALGEGLALHDGDRLIGTALRWNYGPDFATVGMIIVDGVYRGQGLGARLVDALLAGAGQRSIILNATPDGLELYRRRGFVAFGRTCQHQGIAAPASGAGDAGAVRPARADDWPAIIALDEAASGMPRNRLMAALAGTGSTVVLAGEDGSVKGYAVCREFGRGLVVGPVVAPGQQEATQLIARFLSGLAGRFVRVNAPEDSGLGQWLAMQGLIQVDAEEAMVRGWLPSSSAQARIFSLCSNSLG